MIELKTYSLTELRQVLSISKKQWETRKDDLLEHLKIYFDYNVVVKNNRYTYFTIYEQFAEYEPLPKKKDKAEMIAFYKEQVEAEVQEQKWNTGSNIARNIEAKGHNKYEHKTGTMTGYICPIIREDYISIGTQSQWMRAADDRLSYVPLTEEQNEYLSSLWGVDKESASIMADYKAGYITKRWAKEALFEAQDTRYCTVMAKFKKKYNFIPIHVKDLQSGRSAF